MVHDSIETCHEIYVMASHDRHTMFYHLSRIVKAMSGEIYGTSVREILEMDAADKNDVHTHMHLMNRLSCRFTDLKSIENFIRVVSASMEVTRVFPGFNESEEQEFCVVSGEAETRVAVTSSQNTYPLFDIDMLVSTTNGIFMCRPPRTMHVSYNVDRIGTVMRRILARRFCFVGIDLVGLSLVNAMLSAMALVEQGWKMDHSVMGAQSWIASSFNDLTFTSPPGSRAPTNSNTVCAICLSCFSPTDIVIMLPCNHTFHAVCDTSHATVSDAGICKWIEGHNSCPCCRRLVGGSMLLA